MRAEDGVRIRHMIEASEAAIQFATGRKRQDLDNDLMLLFAIVRAVEILGEAASKRFSAGQAVSISTWKNSCQFRRFRRRGAYAPFLHHNKTMVAMPRID